MTGWKMVWWMWKKENVKDIRRIEWESEREVVSWEGVRGELQKHLDAGVFWTK